MDRHEEKFASVDDLYKRVLPALNTKVDELKRERINFISAIDIWNYCASFKWKNKKDLRIYEMVHDIFSIDVLEINQYKRRIKNER